MFNLIFLFMRREKEKMAIIYATLIIKGKKKFSDVPTILKAKVKQILIDLELEELITE